MKHRPLSATSFNKLGADWQSVLVKVDGLNGNETQLPLPCLLESRKIALPDPII